MKNRFLAIAGLAGCLLTGVALVHAHGPKTPEVQEQKDGTKTLVLPDDVDRALTENFPGYRMPAESEFDPEMVSYFHSNLIGIHPAVAWGDFNGDHKRDYMMLVITGDSKWGPLCDLVILNGGRHGYEVNRIAEVYTFKDNYVSFQDSKLYKGRYKHGGWYINWDKKTNQYVVSKS